MDQEPVVIIGGVPRIMAPRPASKGLWFIGYQLGPSMLGVAGKQSRPLAGVIANDLAVQQKPRIRARKQTSRPGHEVRDGGMEMVNVHGSTAVVTGGQRGLGKALVAELIKRGAFQVYATARQPEASTDPRVVSAALDVTSAKSIAALAEIASDATIVFNNAGISGARPSLLKSEFRDIRTVFETNYFGALRVARAFAPVLARNGGGALVDIHSVLSWVAGNGAYGDSKAALWSATNSLRMEMEPQKTLVTGVHVGYIDTDMVRSLDVPKIAASQVAAAILDGIEDGQTEVLVDEFTRQFKAALSGPVEGLQLR